jgi:hypothetical protein
MLLTRADKWLIAVLLVLGSAGVGFNLASVAGGEREAQISREGRLVATIPLRPGYSQEIRLGGAEHFNVVVAADGRVRVREADCPDQICVRTGWVSVAPQQIVCLPYRTVIKIVAKNASDVDDIAR